MVFDVVRPGPLREVSLTVWTVDEAVVARTAQGAAAAAVCVVVLSPGVAERRGAALFLQ